MPDNLYFKRPEDAQRINLSQSYEVKYWRDKFNCSEDKLRNAVNAVGDSVEAVKKWMRDH